MKNILQLSICMIVLALLVSPPLRAEEDKLKSMSTAVILGLDPFPADALFYAGKTKQGIANLGLGALGAGLAVTGILNTMESNDRCISYSDGGYCADAMESGLISVLGIGMYASALIWDAVSGIGGVSDHNKQVRKYSSLPHSIRPILSAHPSGGFLGAQVSF